MAGLAAVAFGFTFSREFYKDAPNDPLPNRLGMFARMMRNRFYFDEIYACLIRATQEMLAKIADFFDRWIIAGLVVRGAHGTVEIVGRALRLVQTGNLQTYTFLFVLGVALLLFFVISH